MHPYYQEYTKEPSTPDGVHQQGHGRCRGGSSVLTPSNEAHILRRRSEIYPPKRQPGRTNFFACQNPPTSPEPRRRRRSVSDLVLHEGNGVRGRTPADAPDQYRRPHIINVPQGSSAGRRGTPGKGYAVATAPYSLGAVVADSPAGESTAPRRLRWRSE